MANGTDTGQGQGAQPAQPAQPTQQAQPSAAEQKHNDRLGLRVLLWTGKIVVAIVYIYAVAAMITIAFGFFLLLFGASPDASFSGWIYTTAAGFMEPFSGMFSPTQWGDGAGTISIAALFAIAAYAVLAWLVHMLYESIRHQLWKAEHGQ